MVANPSLRGALATKQSSFPHVALWIASRSLSSGAHSRDPLARNDGEGHCAPYFPTHFGGRFSENALGPSI